MNFAPNTCKVSLRAAPYHVNKGRDCETMPNSLLHAFPAFGEDNLCKKINTLNMQGCEYVNSIWHIARKAFNIWVINLCFGH